MNRHDKATVFKALRILGWKEKGDETFTKKVGDGEIIIKLDAFDLAPETEVFRALEAWGMDEYGETIGSGSPPAPEKIQPPGISHPIPNPGKQATEDHGSEPKFKEPEEPKKEKVNNKPFKGGRTKRTK